MKFSKSTTVRGLTHHFYHKHNLNIIVCYRLKNLQQILLALVTRDLILAFPVTYLAKTRQNLL